MSIPIRVLIVEDSEDDAFLLVRTLRRNGFDPSFERVDTAERLEAALDRQAWDLVLSDFTMPQFNAVSALELLQARDPDLPFIIHSGSIGEDTAVAAMKAGANDYVMKDNPARLIPAITRELREAEARRERRRLEQQLMQSQKMESIGRLAGGIAHDFNNLLTAIIGYAELAEESLPADCVAQNHLRAVLVAADRAAGLTRQLLAFARKQIIQPRIVNLNDLLRNLEKILPRLLGEDIEIVTLLAPDLGQVRVDPGQCEQVLLNLAVNARDAMPGGGRLTIETGNVTLDTDYTRQHFDVVPGPYVMLAVTDTGVGIDSVTQARIFEPFFTTKDPGKGTGLGLSTCYGIIKQSGGDIWLYSEPGKGTTFKIYLPRVEESATTAEPSASNAIPRGTETILLVEDETQVRAVAAQALRAQGFRVLEAADGFEAQRVAHAFHAEIHLLISDVVMPQMGGKELTEWLRAIHPDTKVLLTSGYTDATITQQGVPDRGIAFLQKPFSPRDLVRKVRDVLDA